MAAERRRRWWWLVIVLVLAGLGAAVFVLLRPDRTAATPGARPAPPTASVVRADLAQTTRADGTLGFDGSVPVPAAPGGGIATWLPAPGTVVHRGERVYSVNNRPVPLFHGDTPLWRELAEGMDDGPDVRELRDNLRALGFAPNLTEDSAHFSAAVGDAVARWQRAIGVEDSRRVRPGEVVVAPSDLRVVDVRGTLGGSLTPIVLTASGTGRVVTVDLGVAQQGLARVGAAVRVLLPTGEATPGRVASVGTVATAAPRDPAAPTGNDAVQATLPVRVTLDKPEAAGSLDGAPVAVEFTSDVHRGVLAVPLVALLAMPDGDYAVDVVQTSGDGSWHTRRVVVRLGFFATGQVEVAADGLTEGMRVQVPAR